MCQPRRSLFIAFPRLKSFCTVILAFAIAAVVTGLLAGPAPAGDQLAKHPALQPFNVAGKKLPPDLFFVRTRVPLAEEDGVVVLGSDKDVFLVSGDPDKVWALAGRGCAVMRVEDWEPSASPVARDWTRIDTPDPDIEAMVNQVEWTGVLDKVQWLVDFGTRYDYADNHTEVAQAIRDKLASYGLQAELKPFQWDGMTMWSVEATQVGARYPDSYVVICGHFDSISEKPMELAPGADDNGTGAAAVLTAAEILSQHTFDYSIRYICFGGEELGLIGSFFYTMDVRTKNLDLVGVLNFDMLGYWEPGVEKDLEIETNEASQWLAQAVLNAADLYTETEYELHVYDWAWWGDHFWFWMFGYPAVNHEESWDWYDPDFNPYYHTSEDLPQHIDPDFTVENIRVGVASLATLADAKASIQTTFDVKPGSCPNPFNPKSKGVITAALLGTADFDVSDISMGTLRLEGVVSPVWVKIADVGSVVRGNGHPCADTTPDGIADLSMKFDTQHIAATLGPIKKGDAVTLRLTCRLIDGTVIEGQDVVAIVGETDGPTLSGRAAEAPETFALYQNVPNPFNPVTTIRYDVPAGGGQVSLRVYDVNGRLVRTLVSGRQTAGEKTVTWDGLNEAGGPVATGVYFCRLIAGDFNEVRKMTILK